jgi:hypothetical protein
MVELRPGDMETFELTTTWRGLLWLLYGIAFNSSQQSTAESIKKTLEKPPQLRGTGCPEFYLFSSAPARKSFLESRFKGYWEWNEFPDYQNAFLKRIEASDLNSSTLTLTQMNKEKFSACLLVSKFFNSEMKRHTFRFIIQPREYEAYLKDKELNFTDIDSLLKKH